MAHLKKKKVKVEQIGTRTEVVTES